MASGVVMRAPEIAAERNHGESMSIHESPFSRLSQVATLVVLASFVQACDGTSEPTPDVLRVGGTYSTAVTLTQNTCTGITVQSLSTVVNHAEGSANLSLQHGPVTYQGTVAAAGAFTTAPVTVQGAGPGDRTSLSITGQFSATGFVADVSAAVTLSNVPSCTYTVHWVGTKQGSPNTFP